MTLASDGTSSWLDATLVVAYMGLFGTLLTIAVNGYKARTARKRDQFAEALSVVLEYWEFPYVVRRRRHDQPEAERIRISEAMRDVQKRLAFHQAWIRTESRRVSKVFDELVVQTRVVIGGQICEAWETAPINDDSQMNISDVSFDGLSDTRDRYLKSVEDELSFWPESWRKSS